MSHRRRRLAVLAIVVSLLLAGAPVTTALPDRDPATPAVVERHLDWLRGLGDFLARIFDATEAPPASDRDLANPVPGDAPQSTLQMPPVESEAGPHVDPDG